MEFSYERLLPNGQVTAFSAHHNHLDFLPELHIIGQNKQGCDEDEYALNDGPESRRSGESLSETTTPNGPPSLEAKALDDQREYQRREPHPLSKRSHLGRWLTIRPLDHPTS